MYASDPSTGRTCRSTEFGEVEATIGLHDVREQRHDVAVLAVQRELELGLVPLEILSAHRCAVTPHRDHAVATRRVEQPRLAAGKDEAERVVLRVEVHPEERARLHRVLACAKGQHRRLADVEVVELEVQVLLLRMLLAGPLRRLIVVDPLEAQRGTDVARAAPPSRRQRRSRRSANR